MTSDDSDDESDGRGLSSATIAKFNSHFRIIIGDEILAYSLSHEGMIGGPGHIVEIGMHSSRRLNFYPIIKKARLVWQRNKLIHIDECILKMRACLEKGTVCSQKIFFSQAALLDKKQI